jgi:hypothetical protein
MADFFNIVMCMESEAFGREAIAQICQEFNDAKAAEEKAGQDLHAAKQAHEAANDEYFHWTYGKNFPREQWAEQGTNIFEASKKLEEASIALMEARQTFDAAEDHRRKKRVALSLVNYGMSSLKRKREEDRQAPCTPYKDTTYEDTDEE